MQSQLLFARGSLEDRLSATTERALSRGALQPLATQYELIEDGGITFLVRVLASLARKDEDARLRRFAKKEGRDRNPFLPYEKDLFVSPLTDTHIALLNKFNVIEKHLLVVTRTFVHQDEYPDAGDFTALLAVMAEYESLGFYNGGTVAGASQTHRHLQVVPLPFRKGEREVPATAAFEAASWSGSIGVSPLLPFRHAFCRAGRNWYQDPLGSGRSALKHFHGLLQATGMEKGPPPEGRRHSLPYNLLLTKDWMLLVPRRRECFDGASVNALGFAGALLVRTAGEMAKLKEQGPLEVLAGVAFPAEA